MIGIVLAAAEAASAAAGVTACRLERSETRFRVECPDRRVDGPLEWLMPPAEVEAEKDNYVSSFQFGPDVSAIPLGRGFVAFHVASYDLMTEGSAAAAAGRDVFFIFDPATRALQPAGPQLGITRERLRADGCFRALNHKLYVADVDADGMLDLGVEREELVCRLDDSREDREAAGSRGPFDCRQPIGWHVFRSGQWKATPEYDGNVPAGRRELPLLGISRSPVDFVRSLRIRIEPCGVRTQR